MKIAKGFTLSEILIAMLVLGIIVAASVPIILNLTPNKNVIMMKKAYYATENIVHSLINDQNYYPDMTANCIRPDGTLKDSGVEDCFYGFDYAPAGIHIPELGAAVTVATTNKLQCLFASKLNIKEDLADVCAGTETIVTTMDGMSWKIDGLSNGPADGTIQIDVDGINKGVHAYHITPTATPTSPTGLCADADTWSPATCNSALTARAKKNFDRIQITISRDGKLSIEDNQEEFAKIIRGEVKLMGDDDDTE